MAARDLDHVPITFGVRALDWAVFRCLVTSAAVRQVEESKSARAIKMVDARLAKIITKANLRDRHLTCQQFEREQTRLSQAVFAVLGAPPANDRVGPALPSDITPWLNKIHVGDCLEVMRRMPTGSVDLVITSPPYNLRNTTGGGIPSGVGIWKDAKLRNGYPGHSDDMPRAEYVAWQRACLTEMMRVVRNDGAVFFNHKWRVQDGLLEDQKEIVVGFPVRQIIVWDRAGGYNFNPKFFVPNYEVIYVIPKSKAFKLACLDPAHPMKASAYGDVWRIPKEQKNPHPAPFPIEIPRRIIEATGAQVVLDPFSGSGTTALAAEMLGRQWIGIEQAQEYVEMAEARLANWRAGVARTG